MMLLEKNTSPVPVEILYVFINIFDYLQVIHRKANSYNNIKLG